MMWGDHPMDPVPGERKGHTLKECGSVSGGLGQSSVSWAQELIDSFWESCFRGRALIPLRSVP